MTIKIKNRREVMIYHDPACYTGQVGATQLKNGDVLVIFNEMRGMRHLDFDSLALMRSKDNGETWDPGDKTMVWPCTHHFGSDTPSIKQLSDGRVLANFLMTAFVERKGIQEDLGPQSEHLELMRQLEGPWLTSSDDDGYTWEPVYKASIAPMRWGQPADEVVELPNGTLLMACQGALKAHGYTYVTLEETDRCFLIRSDNGGLDWEHYSTIAHDASGIVSFQEPGLARTADGVLVCMMRSVHRPRARLQHLWVAYSMNDGESWSRPEPTNLWGYPADLTLLQDGRMLCTYSYRRDPWGVRACISEQGTHWDVANEFVVAEGGIAPPKEVPNLYWHIGYPTSIQLNDGTIFTVYHQWTQEKPYVQYVVGVLYELDL